MKLKTSITGLMNVKKNNIFIIYWRILKESISQFTSDNILTRSAALSYYTVFSLPPMLIIVFWAAGLMSEGLAVREAVFNEIGGLIGKTGSDQIRHSIETAHLKSPSLIKTIVGLGLFLMYSF